MEKNQESTTTISSSPLQHKFLNSKTVDEFSTGLFESLIRLTKYCNQLPGAEESSYFQDSESLKKRNLGNRVLQLTQKFLEQERGVDAPQIVGQNLDTVLDSFESITDVVDSFIERVDAYYDETLEGKLDPKIIISKAKPTGPVYSARNQQQEYHIFHGSNIPRSQLSFSDLLDNSNNVPWTPKLNEKPNAMVPLNSDWKKRDDLPPEIKSHMSNLGLSENSNTLHPYEYELLNFEYLPEQLKSTPEQLFKPLNATPLTWVQTLEQLKFLVEKLNKEKEIAIDLENHDYRSFQGFVCLMQISTRTEDFLVDTLKLRSHMWLLNKPFTNPKILKVFHGADSDIIWLQRDFNLYIVNLFDTGQASRILEFTKFSLAYLLHFYCNVKADKKFQLADWRIRPLPEEMTKYAREDTHYLLYIYDCMKNELISRGNEGNNLLLAVLSRSKMICLKIYQKEIFTETSHLELYNKYNLVFNPAQLRTFAALYAWRDSIARQEDESIRYVLPNHMLFRISEAIPSSISDLFACCNPVPPLLRLNANDVLQIITDAAKDRSGNSLTISTPTKVIDLNSNVDLSFVRDGIQGNSPIITAEQLYSTTGWIENSTPAVNHRVKSLVKLSKANENLDSSSPLTTSLIFESDGEDDEEELKAKEVVSLIEGSLPKQILPLQTLFVDQKQKGSSSGKENSSSVSNVTTPKEIILVPIVEPKTEPKPSSESKSSTVSHQEEEEETDEVPQSMAEIFKLSNQIKRKRNKEKRKLREESKQYDDEGTDQKSKRHKGDANGTNPVDFMKDIGWIDEEGVNKTGTTTVAAPQKKSSADKTFTPFDYSSASLPSTQKSEEGKTFNPYVNIQQHRESGSITRPVHKSKTGNRSSTASTTQKSNYRPKFQN